MNSKIKEKKDYIKKCINIKFIIFYIFISNILLLNINIILSLNFIIYIKINIIYI